MSSQRINFTIKALNELPAAPPKKRVYVYDTKTPKLILDISSAGTKTFYWYGKVGKDKPPERIRIGRFPETKIEQARDKAVEITDRVNKGKSPQDDVRSARDEVTVRELFREYIDRHASKVKKTWQVMEKDFERNAVSIAGLKLSTVDLARAEKLHQALNKERGPYTANRTNQLLRAIFNKGIKWKLFKGDNPFSGVSLFPEKPRDRFLNNEEAALLLQKLETDANDTLRDFIKLSLFTGVRKNNLASMRWKDIDFSSRTWMIPDTKTGAALVSLGVNEMQILEKRKARLEAESRRSGTISEFVFPGDGKTGHLIDIKKAWMSFRKRVGLEDVTIHDLRRSLAAGMASNNANIALVKDALHHKDVKTTMNVYARTRKDAVADAKESVQNAWLKQAAALDKEEPKDITLDEQL